MLIKTIKTHTMKIHKFPYDNIHFRVYISHIKRLYYSNIKYKYIYKGT